MSNCRRPLISITELFFASFLYQLFDDMILFDILNKFGDNFKWGVQATVTYNLQRVS